MSDRDRVRKLAEEIARAVAGAVGEGLPGAEIYDEALEYWASRLTAFLAEREADKPQLFTFGHVTLSSGTASTWKIDCDALTDSDLEVAADLIHERVHPFGSVEGIPSGGDRLASILRRKCTEGPLLIVDDVLTTGGSMERQRAGREAIGAVLFARGECPSWVTPLFQLSPIAPTFLQAQLHRALGEGAGLLGAVTAAEDYFRARDEVPRPSTVEPRGAARMAKIKRCKTEMATAERCFRSALASSPLSERAGEFIRSSLEFHDSTDPFDGTEARFHETADALRDELGKGGGGG